MTSAGDRDLMLGLGLLALVVLVGVALHLLWQARRARPRQARAGLDAAGKTAAGGGLGESGTVAPHDVLDDERRLVPALDDALPPAPDGLPAWRDSSFSGAVGEPSAEGQPAAAHLSAAAIVVRQPGRLDPLIDAIVPLRLEAPVSAELALTHLPGSRRAGTKPMGIEGLNAADGRWELPARGQRYGEFQAGVQLVNRAGALNEIEYSEFVQKVEAFALGVGALADIPDMLDVVSRARELDAFASPRDAQLSVVLRAASVAWSLGYVQQCAARHGFVKGMLAGRLVLPGQSPADPPVLVLSFDAQSVLADDPQAAALREIGLSLDVAQTPEAAEPFPTWHRVATELAAEMDAVIVDEDGNPVTLHAFDAIGRDLDTLYRQLEGRDLAAGTAAARRLFS
jgi:hypothetical protein